MGLRRDLDDLAKMYSEGGLIVLTLANGESPSPAERSSDEPYNGRVTNQPGLRTAVQLDGDVVTTASRHMLFEEGVWREHITKVDAKLAVVASLQHWVRRSWLIFMIIPLGWLLADLLAQESVEAALLAVRTTLLSSIIVVARRYLLAALRIILLPPVRLLVGWYLNRQRRNYLSGEA